MRGAVLALAALAAAPVAAEGRDLCPDRPGLGTPACTVDRGRVVVETGLADWTLDKSAGARSDTVLIGDTLLRIGVSDTIELQLGWTPFGYNRERVGAVVDKASRVGDVTLGAKINLHNPDGSGFSAALLPYTTLPTGRQPIGAGDWGGGLVVPLSYDLSDTVSLQASPEVDAAVDADGDGRHFAYGGTVGLGFNLTDAFAATVEVQAIRDRDPAGHATEAYGGLSVGYQTSKDVQLDVGTNVGLNHGSSDFQLYAGVSKRF
jgi:hypothetical protein